MYLNSINIVAFRMCGVRTVTGSTSVWLYSVCLFGVLRICFRSISMCRMLCILIIISVCVRGFW